MANPNGRPKMAESEKKNLYLQIRVNEEEKAIIAGLAKAQGKSISKFVVDTLIKK